MDICTECGRVKPEVVYELNFRPNEIPDVVLQEAQDMVDAEEKAGSFAGYGGSKHRLLRIMLKKVILAKLRFWMETKEWREKSKAFAKEHGITEHEPGG